MLPYALRLRDAGHRCRVAASFPAKYDYFPWLGFRPSQKLKRLARYGHWWMSRLRRDEVVVIDREIYDDPSTTFEERFRRTAARFVLDLDDAVFLRYPEKFERLVPLADLVICGNRLIEEWVQPRNPSTIVIPSCVDLDKYPLRNRPESNDPLRIGWMGTASNIPCLDLIAPALRTLAARHEFEFFVVTNDPRPLASLDLSGVSVQHALWSSDTEFDLLNSMDIGVMPLSPESEWDRNKCGMKLIQYMATRVPAVASPVGVNAEILSAGECGFAATSQSDWESHLARLIEDSSLRKKIGEAARTKIEADFSIQSQFPRYEAALRSLFESSDTQSDSQK